MSAPCPAFRVLTSDDTCSLAPRYCDYLRGFGHAAAEDELRWFLLDLLAQPWILAVGGFEQKQLVAFAMGSVTYSALRRSKALLLSDVYLEKRLRGGRAAHELLGWLYRHCRSAGIARVFGNVEPRSRNFFLRKGWQPSHQTYLVYDLPAA